MSQKKYKNDRKTGFLERLPTTSIDSSDLARRSKFNFSYFDGSQTPGVNFDRLDQPFLAELLSKLKSYSREPLSYWRNQRAGGGGLKVLEIYKGFPTKSEFKHPKHVPHDVEWARFRLENLARLVGFIVPAELNNKINEGREFLFCTNTFYVVFVDLEHRFYITETR